MSRNNGTLARFGRVRTNLHDLLCYHVTKHRSLHGWIFNTNSNTGTFCAPFCTSDINYMLQKIKLHWLYVSSVTLTLRICIMLCPSSPMMVDYPLSAVNKCLFCIFRSTIWRSSSPSKTGEHTMQFFWRGSGNNTSSTNIKIYGHIWSEKSLKKNALLS
jgi:hypothetical protein